MRSRLHRAFTSFVARSDDRRLERVAGSERALRFAFAQMVRRFDPDGACGFTGEMQFDLRRSGDSVSIWTVEVADDRATARPGAASCPALTVTAGIADVLRMAAGELDPGTALLEGQLDLAGDWGVAMRLGRMFGAPGAR